MKKNKQKKPVIARSVVVTDSKGRVGNAPMHPLFGKRKNKDKIVAKA